MSQYKIGIAVGSLRKDSWNRSLGEAIARMLPENFACEFIEIGDLPLYNQDTEYEPGPEVTRLRDQIRNLDGVVFITPEYNRSISGVLKNALDHGSRPWGESVWAGKPAGVIGVAGGAIGTAMAQQHLRNILAALNMPTMGQPEAFLHYHDGLFTEEGMIGADSVEFVQNWVNAYANWVGLHKRELQPA